MVRENTWHKLVDGLLVGQPNTADGWVGLLASTAGEHMMLEVPGETPEANRARVEAHRQRIGSIIGLMCVWYSERRAPPGTR